MIVLIVMGFIWYFISTLGTNETDYNYSDFLGDLSEGQVTEVVINQNEQVPTGYLEVKIEGKRAAVTVYVTDVNAAVDAMIAAEFTEYSIEDVDGESVFLNTILPLGISIMAIIFIFLLFSGQSAGGSSGKMMNFGKSRAKLMNESNKKVTFDEVAGLAEEKDELEEIVDFLKSPKKYIEVGARIPKGVILVGPPGTGKTLLAKAVAGEAGVPFFSISGSDFVEMFVGVGASRVRDLFEEAKKNAPCIVFIDEIDAVARRRGTGMGGGHDEREQTLNQMLVEMDGFGVNEGIIVMAATNRVDILDPAILRPGRFDRKVYVGRPDVKGRKEILEVHVKNKPLADDVDLDNVAQTTAGFTGADLENLVNEAAINAAKTNRKYITQADINRSFVKVGIGTEKKSKVISEKEKRITAYHEAGHAILFHALPDVGPVHTVSIIPTGNGAAGYTMPLPERDDMFNTKGKMLQSIMVSLGGRIAEELIFDDITTGASQDIKQATSYAKSMVTKFGMSDSLGLICYGDEDEEVFIGRDLAHARGYADTTAAKIDEEVKRIVDECYVKAKEIIIEHKDALERCAEYLLKKEKIGQKEFEALYNNEPIEEEIKEEVKEEAETVMDAVEKAAAESMAEISEEVNEETGVEEDVEE
ncbi:MAG: ATP-dependent zinc metalloprotease FtsH [Lachnospiraceae bacterium]|nr:ATP-dependent zinc metalloprotease FtsH [Lachnospiraceae bacterium]